MNDDGEILALLCFVLGLAAGESWVLREQHLVRSTVHRYRDGWYVLIDQAPDRQPCPRALIGWVFRKEQDMADFLLGDLGPRHISFALIGEGP
jgi:hypothetical protein